MKRAFQFRQESILPQHCALDQGSGTQENILVEFAAERVVFGTKHCFWSFWKHLNNFGRVSSSETLE